VKSGIANAIASLPDGIKGNTGAIAETIANNVRSTIIKQHLRDPAYYDRMSVLLNEVIADLKARRIAYAEYLKRIAELVRQVQAGQADDTPPQLTTPGLRALYNNLKRPSSPPVEEDSRIAEQRAAFETQNKGALDLALKIDETVKQVRSDGWRGVQAREQVIKQALYTMLQDIAEVERIFLIITQQNEY
jgi:type I restriction enzyme R subunit